MRLLLALFLAALLAGWPGFGGPPLAQEAEGGIDAELLKRAEWTNAQLASTDPFKLIDLGKAYALGTDVPKNPELAARMFAAASRHRAWLAARIGRFYQLAAKDADRPIIWYKTAIAGGDKLSHSSLGSLYFYGRLVPHNYSLARDHFLKAADGIAAAFLGQMYLQGLGTMPNPAIAKQWFLEAARQGNRLSMQNIGETYLKMNGIDQEYDTEALAWFIASKHFTETRFGPLYGERKGLQIDALTILMKTSDILAAKRQAAKIIEIASPEIKNIDNRLKALRANRERRRAKSRQSEDGNKSP